MKRNFIDVFDTRICYYTQGKGRPLVFIHGHRSDALRWKGITQFLSQKFKVYAPDLPGFGSSPELKKQHTMENYALYINQLVEKLLLKDYVLFAGSMGGIVGLKMLIQKPKLTPARLVLAGTPYDIKYLKISLRNKIFIFLAKNLDFSLAISKKIINSDFLLYWLLYFSFPQEDRKRQIVEYEMRQWRVMSMEIWRETALDMMKVSFSKEKFQTKIPTFIITTRGDQYFNNQKTIEGLQKICPNSQVLTLPIDSHVPKGELKVEHLREYQSLLEEI